MRTHGWGALAYGLKRPPMQLKRPPPQQHAFFRGLAPFEAASPGGDLPADEVVPAGFHGLPAWACPQTPTSPDVLAGTEVYAPRGYGQALTRKQQQAFAKWRADFYAAAGRWPTPEEERQAKEEIKGEIGGGVSPEAVEEWIPTVRTAAEEIASLFRKPQPTMPALPQQTTPSWLPWVLGAAALAVVGVIIWLVARPA